jgi:pyrroline-5-carboxylate reductase
MPLITTRIAFIGGCNMARSLIAGLIADGYDAAELRVSDPDPDKRRALAGQFGVQVSDQTAEAIDAAEIIVLCVKPQVASVACREVGALITKPLPLLISVMAGVTEASIQGWLGQPAPLVRAMPNTPVLVQSGAIGLHAAAGTKTKQTNLAEEIMRAGGLTHWVKSEAELDTVTALSGSGPAYFFLFMEALEEAAIAEGLDPEGARLLSIQTALGAARMAVESDESPQQLRRRVTSPGGTTERAIAVFEEGGLPALTLRAVAAARQRAHELSELIAEEK